MNSPISVTSKIYVFPSIKIKGDPWCNVETFLKPVYSLTDDSREFNLSLSGEFSKPGCLWPCEVYIVHPSNKQEWLPEETIGQNSIQHQWHITWLCWSLWQRGDGSSEGIIQNWNWGEWMLWTCQEKYWLRKRIKKIEKDQYLSTMEIPDLKNLSYLKDAEHQ